MGAGICGRNKRVVDSFERLSRFVVLFCIFLLFVGSFFVAFFGVGRLFIQIFVAHKHLFRLHFKNNNNI